MPKKAKKFIFPGMALIASAYISISFLVGAIIGYLATNLFQKKFINTGKVKPLTFDLGNWEIHLHHWIQGSLAVSAVLSLSPFTSSIFWIGALGGLVFHDIHNDKEWYKVLYKK